MRAVAAHDDCGPIKLLEHARGDNAHYADVPGFLALDDDEVFLRLELRAHRAKDFVSDATLDFLAFAVAGIQTLGNRHRLTQVTCLEQAQRLFGGFQTAGCIETWGQLKPHLVGANGRRRLRNVFQRHQPRALGGVQPVQTGGNQDPILACERHDIRNRAERD